MLKINHFPRLGYSLRTRFTYGGRMPYVTELVYDSGNVYLLQSYRSTEGAVEGHEAWRSMASQLSYFQAREVEAKIQAQLPLEVEA